MEILKIVIIGSRFSWGSILEMFQRLLYGLLKYIITVPRGSQHLVSLKISISRRRQTEFNLSNCGIYSLAFEHIGNISNSVCIRINNRLNLIAKYDFVYSALYVIFVPKKFL